MPDFNSLASRRFNASILGLRPGMSGAPQRVGSMPELGLGPVLICQGACKLNGIGTLLQPNDQPVLQCPDVSETSGEPLAGPYRFVLKTDVKAPVLWPVPTSRAVKSTVQALLLSLARFTPPFLCLSKIPPASVFLSSHAFEGASSLFQWPAASRWTIPIVTSGTGMIVLPLYFGRFKVDEVSFRPAWLLRL
jgi:hypothetical protein